LGFGLRTLIAAASKCFDHLDACPTVLGDLVNVGTLHQAQTDISVSQAVGGAAIFGPLIPLEFAIKSLIGKRSIEFG
jgi:hypothetical protein